MQFIYISCKQSIKLLVLLLKTDHLNINTKSCIVSTVYRSRQDHNDLLNGQEQHNASYAAVLPIDIYSLDVACQPVA